MNVFDFRKDYESDCDNGRFLFLTKKCVSDKEYFNVLFKRIKQNLKDQVFSKHDYKNNFVFIIRKDDFFNVDYDFFVNVFNNIFDSPKLNFVFEDDFDKKKYDNSVFVDIFLFNSEILSVFLLKFLSSNVDSSENLFYKNFLYSLNEGKVFFPFLNLYFFEVEDLVKKFYEDFVLKVSFDDSFFEVYEHIKFLEKTHRDVFSSLSKSFFKLSSVLE